MSKQARLELTNSIEPSPGFGWLVPQSLARIEEVMEPFRDARDLISTIPGISTKVADVIIAETGADMSRFPTAGHLASWPAFVQVPTNLQAT
jgi:hypothetical protein